MYVNLCKSISKKMNLNECERMYEQARMSTIIIVNINLIVSLSESLIVNTV